MIPYHFEPHLLYVPKMQWADKRGRVVTEGGYEKRSKRFRRAVSGKPLHLVRDFEPMERGEFRGGEFEVPGARLWGGARGLVAAWPANKSRYFGLATAGAKDKMTWIGKRRHREWRAFLGMNRERRISQNWNESGLEPQIAAPRTGCDSARVEGAELCPARRNTMQSKMRCLMLALIYLTIGFASQARADDPLDHWHLRNTPLTGPLTGPTLHGISYGNGQWVAVGNRGAIVTSSDGVNWASGAAIGASGTIENLSAISYGNGQWVAVGAMGTIVNSPDGVTWTPQISGTSVFLYAITYGNGRWVAVGYDDAYEYGSAVILASSDGVTWTFHGTLTPTPLYGISYGKGLWVGVGYDEVNAIGTILSSSDGVTWTTRAYGISAFYSISYGNGQWVAVGWNGTILTSSDGITWTPRNSGSDSFLFGVSYANDQWVAVGSSGTILTSFDGITWTPHNSGATYGLNGISYGNGTWVAVGWNSTILQSDPVGNGGGSFGPQILQQPQGLSVNIAQPATFTVVASGQSNLNYQWRFNSITISSATSSTFVLNATTAANSGAYSVDVWNTSGFVSSAKASLTVLSDGANGTVPLQIQARPPPMLADTVDSLIVITHGYEFLGPFGDVSWVTDMADAIKGCLTIHNLPNWSVDPYIWSATDWSIPEIALASAHVHGVGYGFGVAQRHLKHVHLIGHSAGAGFVDSAASMIRLFSPETTIHATFLDPYLDDLRLGAFTYGSAADWADCYSAQNALSTFTGGPLLYAYNVDVTWTDPEATIVDNLCASQLSSIDGSTPMFSETCGFVATSSHSYPHLFYTNTIMATSPCWGDVPYGFPMSKEGGHWADRGLYPEGKANVVLCNTSAINNNTLPINIEATFLLSALPHLNSDSRVSLLDNRITLKASSIPQTPNLFGKSERYRSAPHDASTNIEGASWFSAAVTITNPISFVQMDTQFTDTNAGEGLLTIYWNTNPIGLIDERVASTNYQTSRFMLPATVTNASYVFSVRLAAFSNVVSSVTISNIAVGFVGFSQSIILDVLAGNGNNVPIFKLSAPAGYNYLLQSSTNLQDWVSTATVFNTNGVLFFSNPLGTNSNTLFYRALLPQN